MNQAAAVTSDAEESSNPALSRTQFWGLMLLSAGAYFATGFLAEILGYFTEPGFNASILLDPHRSGPLVLTVLVVLIFGEVATYVGKFIRPDAGLFVAACAVWALRRNGGMARDVYLAHPVGSTFLWLALELAILGLIFGFLFFLVRKAVAKKHIPDDADLDLIRPKPEPFGQKLLATATTALVMMVLLLLTLRSDERMQVTGMVFVSALLATMSTVRFIPATPSIYFWAGPFVVGLVGYLASSVRGTANLPIGDVAGYFGALARAMPLDYASAGVAGALYGYWVARGWIPEDSLEPEKA